MKKNEKDEVGALEVEGTTSQVLVAEDRIHIDFFK